MRHLFSIVLLLSALHPSTAHAFWGIADTGDGILSAILTEEIKNTIDTSAQLAQLKQMLDTAKQNVELARSVYAGVEAMRDFNADRFLARSKLDFLTRNGFVGDTTRFADDLRRRGLRGGYFDVDLIRRRGAAAYNSLKCQQQLAAFSEATLPRLDADCARYGYDVGTATSIAGDTESALSDPKARERFAYAPPVATATDGLIDSRLMNTDPALYASILRARALAREQAAEAKALEDQLMALGMTPGAAQQATAQAMLLSNRQLAALNENQAQLLALQKLSANERAQEAAKAQQQQDRAWRSIDATIDRTFQPQPLPQQPSLSDPK